jgi:hypothetical protein
MYLRFTQLCSLFSTIGILVSAAPTTQSIATPLPPSQDPWYEPPKDYETKAPGTILRARKAPGLASNQFGNASEAYSILFRSTDARNRPSYGWTTLLKPKGEGCNTLLSYQIPYNTADVDAGPSQLLYTSPEEQGLIYSDIQTALSQKWWVNVPDFEGPLASFGLGVQEGHATLDSVRAALEFTELGVDANYALWGYSGGSLASEWAAELQGTYAPELQFAGAALGGELTQHIALACPTAADSLLRCPG